MFYGYIMVLIIVIWKNRNEYVTMLAELDLLKEDIDVRVPLSVLELSIIRAVFSIYTASK